MEELVQSPRIQRRSVYFCNFLMVEPGWRASLGRFRLNRWHYFKELLKNLASRHKCGDTLKKQFSVALSLLGEFFFQKQGIYNTIFRFQKTVSPFGAFSPKNRAKTAPVWQNCGGQPPPLHPHTHTHPNHIFGAKIWQLFLEKKKFSPNLELVSPFGNFSAEKKDRSGLTLHKRIH